MLIISNENAAYVELLCGHLRRFTRRLRAIPAEQWEWQPNAMSPSPRIVAQHAWLWLVSDRQHIQEPDALRHPAVTDPSTGQESLCAHLEAETEAWRILLLALAPEELGEERFAFNWRRVNVRWLVWHMCQNVIYKHGQLSTLYFQLGLDGEAPYQPPLPQADYSRLAEMMQYPAIRGVLTGAVEDAVQADVNEKDRFGCTALRYAVWRGDAARVRLLLDQGAERESADAEGWTALQDASWLGDLETVRVLLTSGADATARASRGYSALDLALMEEHAEVAEALRQAGAE